MPAILAIIVAVNLGKIGMVLLFFLTAIGMTFIALGVGFSLKVIFMGRAHDFARPVDPDAN